MWFSMPKGCSRISIELQQFQVEATDENGVNYFRAPDHFSARVLSMPGFAQAQPPEGSPEDLPRADPLRDGAIAQLTGEMTSLRMEVQNLRSDLVAGQSRNTALVNENAALQGEIVGLKALVSGLQEKLEDAGIGADVVPLKKANNK